MKDICSIHTRCCWHGTLASCLHTSSLESEELKLLLLQVSPVAQLPRAAPGQLCGSSMRGNSSRGEPHCGSIDLIIINYMQQQVNIIKAARLRFVSLSFSSALSPSLSLAWRLNAINIMTSNTCEHAHFTLPHTHPAAPASESLPPSWRRCQ